MKNFKNMLKACAAISICLAVSVGCSGKPANFKSISTSDTGAYLVSDGKPYYMENILTIDGNDISTKLYRYMYLSYKKSAEVSLNDTVWIDTPDMIEGLKVNVLAAFQRIAAIEQLAKENGLELTSAEKNAINDEINTMIDSAGSVEEFEKSISVAFMDSEIYRIAKEIELLDAKVTQGLLTAPTDDELDKIYKDLDNSYISLKRIHIIVDSEDQYDEKLALANDIVKRYNAGESFDELKKQYNEETTGNETADVYTLVINSLPEPLTTEVFDLEFDQISEVYESDYGLDIVLRVEIAEEDKQELMPSFSEKYQIAQFEQIVQEKMQTQTIEFADEYDLVSIYTIY